MANQKLTQGDTYTFRANAAIVQFRAVILATAARSVTQNAVLGARILGVAQEAATVIGQEISVAVRPGCVTKAKASGVIPIGGLCTSAADGGFVVAGATQFICGYNLDVATVANQIFSMILRFDGVL